MHNHVYQVRYHSGAGFLPDHTIYDIYEVTGGDMTHAGGIHELRKFDET